MIWQRFLTLKVKYPLIIYLKMAGLSKICPIYIEEYYENTPRNKTIRKLYSVKEVPEIVIDHKRKKIIGE